MKLSNIQDIVRPNGIVVFVTGCSGQDGSYMVDYLLRETNAHVIGGARRLSVENHINLRHLENESRFQLVNFDLTDSHSIYKIIEFSKPDYFINFAGQSFVASSWDFPRQTWECNSTAVLDCLEAIRKNVPTCRFYNAGSSEQFGNVDYVPQDEKHPFKPRSPYGASKCAAHHIIKVYRESYGLYAVQGLLFNHESERRGAEFVTRKITIGISRIVGEIRNGKSVKPIELGHVDSKRDWSHAEDFVVGIWKMLNQPTPKDYVLSSGETHSIREFVELAFKSAGYLGNWDFINGTSPEHETFIIKTNNELVEAVKINKEFYRPAEVDILLGNSELIRRELGWKPNINFESLVSRMVENDLRNVV